MSWSSQNKGTESYGEGRAKRERRDSEGQRGMDRDGEGRLRGR